MRDRPIILSMVLFNEADTIKKCLESVADIIDGVVIVDTGSTDDTKKIVDQVAKDMMGRWVYYECVTGPQTKDQVIDFAAVRNQSLKLAIQSGDPDWILWLDGDDYVPESSIAEFNKLRKDGLFKSNLDALITPYYYSFSADRMPELIVSRERFLNARSGLKWLGAVHECVDLNFRKAQLWNGFVVEHRRTPKQAAQDRNRNLKIYESLGVTNLSTRDMYYYGKELLMAGRTKEGVDVLNRRIAAKDGWVEEKHSAALILADLALVNKDYKLANECCSFDESISSRKYYLLGQIAEAQGRLDLAVFHYENAARISPPTDIVLEYNPAFGNKLPLAKLELLYNKTGRVREAYDCCLKLLNEYYPGNVGLMSDKTKFEEYLKEPMKEKIAQKFKEIGDKVGELREKPIGYCIAVQTDERLRDNPSHRLRRLNIFKHINNVKYFWGDDLPADAKCIVFTAFNDLTFAQIANARTKGQISIVDINEDVLDFQLTRDILRCADRVVACSQALADRIKPINNNVSVILDGHD
jgi:glycosyltransferase involved in cell wall biosynthesis